MKTMLPNKQLKINDFLGITSSARTPLTRGNLRSLQPYDWSLEAALEALAKDRNLEAAIKTSLEISKTQKATRVEVITGANRRPCEGT
jgi:hypothetical protein